MVAGFIVISYTQKFMYYLIKNYIFNRWGERPYNKILEDREILKETQDAGMAGIVSRTGAKVKEY